MQSIWNNSRLESLKIGYIMIEQQSHFHNYSTEVHMNF